MIVSKRPVIVTAPTRKGFIKPRRVDEHYVVVSNEELKIAIIGEQGEEYYFSAVPKKFDGSLFPEENPILWVEDGMLIRESPITSLEFDNLS